MLNNIHVFPQLLPFSLTTNGFPAKICCKIAETMLNNWDFTAEALPSVVIAKDIVEM